MMPSVADPYQQIAIICKDYMTVRKCLKGLDEAAEEYGLDHDFKTPLRGINIGVVRFTVLSSGSHLISEETLLKVIDNLRGIHWDLVYLDDGIDKDIKSRIIIESQTNMQDISLGLNLYNSELVMKNLVIYLCGVNLDSMTLSGPVEVESDYRRITLGD